MTDAAIANEYIRKFPDLPHASKKSQWVSDLFFISKTSFKFSIVKILTAIIDDSSLHFLKMSSIPLLDWMPSWLIHVEYHSANRAPQASGHLIIGFDYDDAITVMRVTFRF